jgi:hypothetical protein
MKIDYEGKKERGEGVVYLEKHPVEGSKGRKGAGGVFECLRF